MHDPRKGLHPGQWPPSPVCGPGGYVHVASNMADHAEGGFDCEFVEKPAKGVQSECPVCLLVLKEPYQVTCCGYGFCRVCIKRVRVDNKPCPCCKADNFDCFEDKGRKRLLNDYQVHCANKKQGCLWVGELGELENHLNSKPRQDKQLEGCHFTQVQCFHCSKPILRSGVEVHQNDRCRKRPFACRHCKEYNSTYEDVTAKHWPVCGSYPVPCPNKCSDETMERQNIDSHVTNDCPLTLVDCDFKGIGCKVRLPRKNLPSHLTEGLVVHVSLQTKQLMDLTVENEQLKQLKQEVTNLKEENKQLKQTVEKLTKDIERYQIGTPLCPIELTMTNFEQHKEDGDEWYSPPFYTHPKGYKMCTLVYAGAVGDDANVYVSLYLKLMKGEYDDQLKWPLRGIFEVQLLSQNGEERLWVRTVTYDRRTPDKYCVRVVDEKVTDVGFGMFKFIRHSKLKPVYLQNDCLKFHITYQS